MGLSALFGAEEERPKAHGARIPAVPVELTQPLAVQPRRRFAEAELGALAESIREQASCSRFSFARPDKAGGAL